MSTRATREIYRGTERVIRTCSNYKETLGQLEGLYAQDKWGDNFEDAEGIRQYSRSNLEYAHTAMKKAKTTSATTDNDSFSGMSKKSSSHSSSSSMRTKAIAEAAASKKHAEYD